MQDLKRYKRKINHPNLQCENKENLNNELQEDVSRTYNSKGCGCNKHDDYDFECDCVCKPKHNNHNCDDECETCQVESDECVENLCSEGSCYPLSAPKYSTANSKPLAIETNRVYDSMKFQVFTDADAPNGEDLFFEYEVVSVNGPIPKSGVVNVNIEKVCMNYTDIVIKPGCTTLEDHAVSSIKEFEMETCEQENLCPEFINQDGELCKTSFEYNVCGNKNTQYSSQGKGERSSYKQKGLKVIVKNLVLELKGKCGCTEVTVLAYPARRTDEGDLELVNRVVFNFNTLTAPMCVPANGTSFTLRQNFQTALNVDCIGKTLLKLVDENCCESYYDFCIPNGIDLILCLEETVSILVTEQIVVLASLNSVEPRVVDTFAKVCDFNNSTANSNSNSNNNGCNCIR